MNNLWKKISAVAVSVLMLVSQAAQAAVTANRIDSSDKAMAVTFYGNDEQAVTVDGGEITDAPSGAPLGGKAVRFDVDLVGQWNYKKLAFAKENDYTEDERVDISGYEDNGYIGMYIKVETEADSYPLGLNFWEHDNRNPYTSNPTVMNSAHSSGWEYGVELAGNYVNNWAFVSIPLSTMHKNAKSTLKHIYQMQLMSMNPSVTADVYIQGLGVYIPEVVTDTKGLSTKLTWVPVEGADRYEVKRDTNFDGSYADVLTSNCTDTTFTDTSVPAEGVYNYAVKAYQGETSISTKKIYANVTKAVLERKVSYYGNEASGYGRTGNWAYESQSDAPLGGYAMSALHTNYNESMGIYRSIIDFYDHSLADYWDNGYLCFYLRTQYSEDLKVILQCNDAGGYANKTYTVSGSSILPGRWNFVKIKLTDFCSKDAIDVSNMKYIMLGQANNEGIRRIQGLGIYMPTEASMEAKAAVDGGEVKLTYTLSYAEASKYEIYRNGEKIADTTETTYTDTPKRDAIHYYTVKALNADGDVICYDETVAGVRAANENVLVNIYANGSASVNDGSVASTMNSPMGGSYISKNASAATVALNLTDDWSAAEESDYIEFYYYYETETPKTFMLEAYSQGWKAANWAVDGENAVSGKWNVAKIKIGDYTQKSDDFDLSNIVQLKLSDVGNAKIAWQGIRIVEGPKYVKVTDVNFESEETGGEPNWDVAEEISVTVSVNNETSSDVTPVVFAAFYDGDEFKSISIVENTKSVDGKTTGTITGTFTIPDELSVPTVRVMVWDSLSGMVPYSTVYGNAVTE